MISAETQFLPSTSLVGHSGVKLTIIHSLTFLRLSLSDLYWEQHYSQIHMSTSYQEETDRLLPEYPLPQQIEKLIEDGKYSNVEDRVTKVWICVLDQE